MPVHKRRRLRWRASSVLCLACSLSGSAWFFAIVRFLRVKRAQEARELEVRQPPSSAVLQRLNSLQEEKPPRLAFLFLVRDVVTTSMIWEAFFSEAKAHGLTDYYSVYTHPRPGYRYKDSFFSGTEIKNRSQVSWGAISVVKAEVLLLRTALRDNDKRNTRFLLLSERCAPLHPFRCLYDYAMSAPALVATWASDDRRSLYDFSRVTDKRVQWRKGHQWVMLTRNEAEAVAGNDDWYNSFYDAHAATPVAAEFRKQFKRKFRHTKGNPDFIHHNFADEHFVQSVLATENMEQYVFPVSPTFIRFGHPDNFLLFNQTPPKQQPRHLLALDITKRMKRDWRATTYEPRHIDELLLSQTRALCRFQSTPTVPRATANDDPRSTLRYGLAPWDPVNSVPECSFSYTRNTLCYLLIRKIPEETVPAYLKKFWPHAF